MSPFRVLARSALAAALAAMPGCTSQTTATRLRAVGDLPSEVAVLPMVRTNLGPEIADLLRERIGGAFAARGYRRIDEAWIDQRLSQAGMQPQRSEWIDSDMRLVAIARSLGIAGVVVLEDFESDAVTTGVYNERSLHGRVRVIDVRRGETTWSYWLDSSAMGGALLQSGQIFDAIGDTFGGSLRAETVRFASLVSLAVAEEMPRARDEHRPGRRPVVDAVEATGDGAAAVAAPTTIEVAVRGTPDCRAFASLPGCLGRYPLSEESPGRYVGTLPVPRPATRVVVSVRDRFGVTSRAHFADVASGGVGGGT